MQQYLCVCDTQILQKQQFKMCCINAGMKQELQPLLEIIKNITKQEKWVLNLRDVAMVEKK